MSARSATHRPFRGIVFASAVVLAPVLTGCGFSQGQLLWAMGFGSDLKVDAEYELGSKTRVLVLVDDPEDRLPSPVGRTDLAEKVGQRLKANKAAGTIIPQEKINDLRRTHTDFEEISCRQVGEKVTADQVIWIAVRDAFASSELQNTGTAAHMSVTVRVINAQAESAGEVRLWPVEHEGRLLSIELSITDVIRADSDQAVLSQLTDEMADQVARLFYKHSVEET